MRGDDAGHQVDLERPLLALDPEGQVGVVDPGVPALLAGHDPVGVQLAEEVDQVVIDRSRTVARPDRLVPGARAVAAQGGHRRSRAGGRTVGLGDHHLDHVAQPAPFGVRRPLPVGRVAPSQHGLGEVVDLFPITQLDQLRLQALDQRPHGIRRRLRFGVPGVVEQVSGQPTPGGTPDRGPVDRWWHRVEGDPVLDVDLGGADAGPEQAGDQDRVVDDGAGVADPQLEGRGVGGGAHVEVGHLGVGDHPGVDQVRNQLLVLLGGAHQPGRPGTGPALPDDRADRGIAGVLLVPVGRAGRQRQQDGEVAGDPLHDLHGEVPVAHPDVDLQTADQLLVDQQPVLLLHPPVAAGGGQLEVGERRARCRPDRRDADVVLGCHLDQPAAEP